MKRFVIAIVFILSAGVAFGEVALRKYSVQEIDALRGVVENKYLYNRFSGPVFSTSSGIGGFSRSYNEGDKQKTVEEQVRTWMFAGKTAKDLLASEK